MGQIGFTLSVRAIILNLNGIIDLKMSFCIGEISFLAMEVSLIYELRAIRAPTDTFLVVQECYISIVLYIFYKYCKYVNTVLNVVVIYCL